MTKKVPDISREVPCPKCGCNPDSMEREEFRHTIIYNSVRDELLVGCWRCGYTWTEEPVDKEQPKVVKR